jgi:hypothetical protein
MPEPDAPGKPRRFWLFLPFVLVGLLVVAICLWWVYLDHQLEASLDRMAAGQGRVHASNSARRIEGFPFRLELMLDDPNFSEPSGWGLAAPRLEAVASVFDPTHAVILAPRGVVLSRPGKGAVAIEGRVLRASLGGFGGGRPRFDVEAKAIAIQPRPGAIPMPFSAVDGFEVHLRPESGDQDRLFLALEGATPTPGTPMSRAADGKTSLQLEATVSQAHALRGGDWPAILRSWQAAGGVFKVVKSQATVGRAVLSADDSALGLEPDGRLHGKLDLRLKEGPEAMMALGAAGVLPPDTAAVGAGLAPRQAHVALKFRAGETMVGPISIGKAPRLY